MMIAAERGLVPFRQWISMSNETVIHGPFNFATVNNRKTRDRIDSKDWNSVIAACHMYNNVPPQLNETRIHFSMLEQQVSEQACSRIAKK
eukprot:12569198-Ditylum_brightwellii.AAC.1